MTTDPIERVARALAINHAIDPDEQGPAETHMTKIDGVPTIISDHRGPLWELWCGDSEVAIEAYKAWLTEQGILIDKLLSGEMVAVHSSDPTDPFNWDGKLNPDVSTPEKRRRAKALKHARDQAKMDYEGGQIIKP
jgi:hypothetical protein